MVRKHGHMNSNAVPPKTKGKKKAVKGKSSSVTGVASNGEKSKEQLWEETVRLQEELDRLREEKHYFKLQTEKAQARLEITNKNLEEAEAHRRERMRQREEANRRHQAEITIYKEKLRHILSEKNNTISELKVDGASSASLNQKQHTEEELALIRDVEGLQAELSEMKMQRENLVQEFALKRQMGLREVHHEYDCRLKAIHAKYEEKTLAMAKEYEETLRMDMLSLDKKSKKCMGSLVNAFFKEQMEKRLAELKTLEKERLQAREKDRLKFKAAKVKKKEPKESEAQASEQNQPKQGQEMTATQAFSKRRAQLKKLGEGIREEMVKNELLHQACEKMERERDDLQKKQMEKILDVQQKSGVQTLLLERKIAAVTLDLEKEEALLCDELTFTSPDPAERSNAQRRLDEIMSCKQAMVDKHQEDLDRECKEYDDLVQTHKQRLQATGASVRHLSFKSSKEILKAAPAKP
ncbi:dynein regulatory complex subunit 4-like [Cololabis saira]|uniref:dynein regulatory complex subunit 4-like n=1 Tax=Cololabis saira TaxID=129043 RepID=UPI002AD47370|nr:dynein regulatory complex subunit 4-like [Cololabis saira]